MVKKQSDTKELDSPVAPVESVESPVETVIDDPCWNCGAQLQDNVCPECAFDKSLLYNLDLEAEKARVRQAPSNSN